MLTFSSRIRVAQVPCIILGLTTLFVWPAKLAYAAPPNMPAVFDQKTVQNLIDTIDQDHDDIILKFGYFIRRDNQAFPAEEGDALLKTALSKEKPNSRRWFLLEAVSGFAGFHLDGRQNEGLEAYNALLMHASKAKVTGADDIVQRAIYEYVATLPQKINIIGGSMGSQTLEKALSVYLSLPEQVQVNAADIPWASATQATADDKNCIKIVQKALSDPATSKTFALYKTAAEVFEGSKPNQAIELLKAAKAHVGKSDAPIFYKQYITLLVHQNKLMAAVAAQKELIGLTGMGHAGLVMLYRKNQDSANYQKELALLSATDSNQQETVDAAVMLANASTSEASVTSEPAWIDSVKLLTNYLSPLRSRDMGEDLRARLVLTELYLQKQKLSEAKAVLSNAPSPQPTDSVLAQEEYAAVKRIQAQLVH